MKDFTKADKLVDKVRLHINGVSKSLRALESELNDLGAGDEKQAVMKLICKTINLHRKMDKAEKKFFGTPDPTRRGTR